MRATVWARLGLSLGSVLTTLSALAGGDAQLPPGAQMGDLIFRTGTETVSGVVMQIDGGGFSHVGLLLGAPGDWHVLHATPSEVPGRPDGVIIDPLAFFIDPQRSQRHVVYHIRDATPAQRQQAIAVASGWVGRPFRLADPSGTYCTVLVWQAWREAGLDLEVRFTPLALPLIPGEYLLPGVLAASPHLQPLPVANNGLPATP